MSVQLDHPVVSYYSIDLYSYLMAGVSRSCTIALSYLMQYKGIPVEEALETVKKKRDVHPNNGFLIQLIQLDEKLRI